jgi:hypothetical protein
MMACFAILSNDLDKANEALLELEIQNPNDEMVLKLSDFRMDMEEGVAFVDKISPRGFDFNSFMMDWQKKLFPDDLAFRISGLKMEEEFTVPGQTQSKDNSAMRNKQAEIDPEVYIERFSELKEEEFMSVCEKLILQEGYKVEKILPVREKDGGDFICYSQTDKKVKALFKIRRWSNQPISDIFLRDLQNNLNENKVSKGYVMAGARLTAGAEQVTQTLKSITVVNGMDLAERLLRIFG